MNNKGPENNLIKIKISTFTLHIILKLLNINSKIYS